MKPTRSLLDMQTESTFTPGPWHVERACGRYEIWPKDKGQTHSFIGIAQLSTDARLIAAAPDLLEAVQLILKRGYKLEASDHATLEAAIAKASGPS